MLALKPRYVSGRRFNFLDQFHMGIQFWKYFFLFFQARTQQLLQQNRELLEHLASLGGYTYTENERTGLTSANISLAPQVTIEYFALPPK